MLAPTIHPDIDAFEERAGRAIGDAQLRALAWGLVPEKIDAARYQHGRILYAAARDLIGRLPGLRTFTFVDIGTGAGFSAVIAAWALSHAVRVGRVLSYDVHDPELKVPRGLPSDLNLVLPSLWETVRRFGPKDVPILLFGGNERPVAEPRVDFGFIDGAPKAESVRNDFQAMAHRQASTIVIANLERGTVAEFVASIEGYRVEAVEVHPARRFAIARKA